MPSKIGIAIVRQPPPALSEAYEPVLFQTLLAWLADKVVLKTSDRPFKDWIPNFTAVVPATRHFIIDRTVHCEPTTDLEYAEPPFPVSWFEHHRPGWPVFGFAENSDLGYRDKDDQPAKLAGLWTIQIDSVYNWSLHVVCGAKDDHFILAIMPPDTAFSRDIKALWQSLEPFLKTGWWSLPLEKTIRYRTGRKRKGRIITVNAVTVLNSENSRRPKVFKTATPREFEYRFWVRGHFRRLKPGYIGLNSDGDRIVPGKTWVKPYIKGDAPEIKAKRWRVKI